ncbi:orotate phosphoribosyltransferase-like protein [Mytilinidion resinicola]|uniref:Orotate phosphoribosyltransferase n=1 Tax=Mytilinidion resinicola TaxID=574789 RepID=A0A6A6YB92_9PEZI|nr:orotate phosphoribosyltransferase-like protein [Mytilinidion resinicola]KAF2805848.1 orotate phosphoribosyltransferase-like protein [Mytilinidion resinicola]
MSTQPPSSLPPHKLALLQSCLSANALKFGTFTLKSGRTSPYFFNAGLFHEGHLLRSISNAFAHTLHHSELSPQAPGAAPAFDILFGPAYKGIPLASTALLKLCDIDETRYGGLSYSFNRKEAKDHGEGGNIVGAPLAGKRVVIIDDVITAGTAIREAIEIIKVQGGELVGIVVAFDRMERVGDGEGSAIGEVRRQYGVSVLSILSLDDVVEFLRGLGGEEDLRRLQEYRERYQARD